MNSTEISENYYIPEKLLIPVRERSLARKRFPMIFHDRLAETVLQKASADGGRISLLSACRTALIQELLAESAKAYLQKYPNARAVRLGCGLDAMFPLVDNGRCRMINLDQEEVIRIRERLIGDHVRESSSGADLMEGGWIEKIPEGPLCILAGDAFLFCPGDRVKALIDRCARRFEGGVMILVYQKRPLFQLVTEHNEDCWMVNTPETDLCGISSAISSAARITHLPEFYARYLPFPVRIALERELALEQTAMAVLSFGQNS